MPEARINEKGQLVDSNTGKVIGKMENGRIVMIKPNPAQINKQESSKSNSDSIKEEKKEIVVPTSFVKELTKYQVTKDSTFTVKFGLVEQDGRFIPIKEDALLNYRGAELVWVKFRMWTFQEELDWKNSCNEFNNLYKCQVLNNDKLNELKIKRLILDWSFGENYDRLKLLHTDGRLSDESFNIFKGLYPSIVNTIIELMNNVLENNL